MRLPLLLSLVLASATLASGEADQTEKLSQQAKELYDHGNYEGALRLYRQCEVLEPSRARWPYSEGLTLKKLGRSEAAAAFHRALSLDPHYKEAEIRQKLSELPGTDSPDDASNRSLMVVVAGAAIALIGLVVFLSSRSKRLTPERRPATPRPPQALTSDPTALKVLEAKFDALAPRLTQCERALALADDREARATLDRAWSTAQQCRTAFARARSGQASLDVAARAVASLQALTASADARLRELTGAQFEQAPEAAEACFFCARPLASPSSRHPVSLAEKGRAVSVTACTSCHRAVMAGETPVVTTVGGKHWSTIDDFDPTERGYLREPGTLARLPWELGPFATLATLAGGALVGAAATGAVLDLASAREASLAQNAAQAAAHSARRSNTDRTWADHS